MMLEELPDLWRTRRAVLQRLDIAADRGERGPELVRDVRHEVPSDLIRAPERRDVVEHQHRAAAAFARDRHDVRDENPAPVPLELDLGHGRFGAAERRRQLRGDVGMAHHLDVVPPLGVLGKAQHRAQGRVGEHQPPRRVDQHDPLDHAGEDRVHVRPLAGHVLQPRPQLARRLFQRIAHDADLVAAVVAHRSRKFAGPVPARHVGNRLEAPAEQGRDNPRDAKRGNQSGAEPDQFQPPHRGQPFLDVRQRQRHTDERHRTVRHRDRGVERVDPGRAASTPRAARTRLPGFDDLGPPRMVLERREPGGTHLGIADDAAIGRDERDALGDQAADAVGFGVGIVEPGASREELGGEGGFAGETPSGVLHHRLADAPGDEQGGGAERDDAGQEGAEKRA